MWIPNASKI
ncbi:hypothetical protein D031_1592A, partial [Vibrio parahaemolyticus VP-48]